MNKKRKSSHKQNIPLDLITRRVLEMTFAPFDDMLAWLTRIGIEVKRRGDGEEAICWNPHLQLKTGFVASSDPITRAVALGFTTAGAVWPHIYPRLLKAVDAEMKKRRATTQAVPPEEQAESILQAEGVEAAQSSILKLETEAKEGEPTPILISPTFQDLFREKFQPAP
ncbi:MAG: hypothetical protein KJ077_00740 [Anaerolineae bacterium]|nr:hypothetical protein [Anaerolineae bacterium]